MGMNDVSQKIELRRHNWKEGWESAEHSRVEIGGGGKQVEIQLDLG